MQFVLSLVLSLGYRPLPLQCRAARFASPSYRGAAYISRSDLLQDFKDE